MIYVNEKGTVAVKGNEEELFAEFATLAYALAKNSAMEIPTIVSACALGITQFIKEEDGDSECMQDEIHPLTKEKIDEIAHKINDIRNKKPNNDEDLFRKMFGDLLHE